MTYGREFYATEDENWISPNGHFDFADAYIDEVNAYDADPQTFAEVSVAYNLWSSFVVFKFSFPVKSNKVKVYMRKIFPEGLIDLQVRVGGEWVKVYRGTIAENTEVIHGFDESMIDRVRMRFFGNLVPFDAIRIGEVAILEVPEVEPEPEPKAKYCMILALFGGSVLSRYFPYIRLFRDRVLPQVITDFYYAFSTWILAVIA